jgi:hypothetical protein
MRHLTYEHSLGAMTRLLLTQLVSFVPLANADYASCILENTKGVGSDVAAEEIKKACGAAATLDNVHRPLGESEVTSKNNALKYVVVVLVLLLQQFGSIKIAEAQEFEPNNDISNAQEINIGSEQTGNSSSAGDLDYYVFEVDQDVQVLVTLTSEIREDAGFTFQIFDEEETLLAGSPCSGSGCLAGETLTTGLREGRYYLKVMPRFINTQPSGDYRFVIQTKLDIDLIEFEPNNDTANAQPVDFNLAYYGKQCQRW